MVSKPNLDICAVCREKIKTAAFLGTGVCGTNCYKVAFGEKGMTTSHTEENLLARDAVLLKFWRKRKPRK